MTIIESKLSLNKQNREVNYLEYYEIARKSI